MTETQTITTVVLPHAYQKPATLAAYVMGGLIHGWMWMRLVRQFVVILSKEVTKNAMTATLMTTMVVQPFVWLKHAIKIVLVMAGCSLGSVYHALQYAEIPYWEDGNNAMTEIQTTMMDAHHHADKNHAMSAVSATDGFFPGSTTLAQVSVEITLQEVHSFVMTEISKTMIFATKTAPGSSSNLNTTTFWWLPQCQCTQHCSFSYSDSESLDFRH